MLFALFLACADDDPRAPADSSSDTTPPVLDTGERAALDAHVAALEGVWSGEANPTPLGAFPFAIALARDRDTVAGATEQLGMGLSFAFEPDATLGYRFTESGTFGGFTQSHVLAPVEASSDAVRWVSVDAPEVLEVVTTVGAASLRIDAWVRGEPHATLVLDRS
jgi:hypothetical protein